MRDAQHLEYIAQRMEEEHQKESEIRGQEKVDLEAFRIAQKALIKEETAEKPIEKPAEKQRPKAGVKDVQKEILASAIRKRKADDAAVLNSSKKVAGEKPKAEIKLTNPLASLASYSSDDD